MRGGAARVDRDAQEIGPNERICRICESQFSRSGVVALLLGISFTTKTASQSRRPAIRCHEAFERWRSQASGFDQTLTTLGAFAVLDSFAFSATATCNE